MLGQLSLSLLHRGESQVFIFVSCFSQISVAGSLSEWEMESVLILSSLLVMRSSLISRSVTSTLRKDVLPPKEEEEMRDWKFYSCCSSCRMEPKSPLFCGHV